MLEFKVDCIWGCAELFSTHIFFMLLCAVSCQMPSTLIKVTRVGHKTHYHSLFMGTILLSERYDYPYFSQGSNSFSSNHVNNPSRMTAG